LGRGADATGEKDLGKGDQQVDSKDDFTRCIHTPGCSERFRACGPPFLPSETSMTSSIQLDETIEVPA
jgi:hypothetical protein